VEVDTLEAVAEVVTRAEAAEGTPVVVAVTEAEVTANPELATS
jgi:hypothetical protein